MTGAKRGRPARRWFQPPCEDGALTVKVANAIHDGKGGFMPVGSKTIPTDDEARASLIAKGLAE